MSNSQKYKTFGGGIVVWTYTHNSSTVGRLPVGEWRCSGCSSTSRNSDSNEANKHARACHAIPA